MPKLVYKNFYRSLRRDIEKNYKNGDKYLKVREIAEKFSVSLQVAQKAVAQLESEGVIAAKPRVGITVQNIDSTPNKLKGKKITVISHRQDYHFYASFLQGIENNCKNYDIKVEFMLNTFEKTDSLEFGEYLMSLDTDGIITLFFTNSALPFYYVLREGRDIVSDIIIDTLPILPAVQTDNYRHAYDAATIMSKYKCKRYFVFGYYPQKNKRFEGFCDGIKAKNQTCTMPGITYIQFSKMNALEEIINIIHNYSESAGFFLSDYSASYFFKMVCNQEKIYPKTILAYDAGDNFFSLSDTNTIRTVSPSFYELGTQLSNVLIHKWQTGKYPEPLQRKI